MPTTNEKLQKFNWAQIKDKLNPILSDFFCIPIIFTIGFLGWILQLSPIAIFLMSIYCLLVFCFCNDIKPTLPVVFSVAFFITDIATIFEFVMFGLSILTFLVGATIFIIKQKKKQEHQ